MGTINKDYSALSKLLRLMENMEKKDYSEMQIAVNYNQQKYIVMLTKETDGYKNGIYYYITYKTKIEIICPSGGNLILKRNNKCVTDNDWTGCQITYDGQEVLPSGDVVNIYGYGDCTEKALESLVKRMKMENNGDSIVTIQEKSGTERMIFGPFTYKKEENLIGIEQVSQYLYNMDTDTYYIELADKMVPLEEVKTKLETVKTNLAKANGLFDSLVMPKVANLDQYFDNINYKQKEFIEMERRTATAIKNKYFPENLQWTNFSKDVLEKTHEMILVKLTEIEDENIEKSVKEKIAGYSDKEIQYTKKYLDSSKKGNNDK